MRHQRLITAAALVAALATAGSMTADDRNFMTAAAAPPNLIFILDTSSSMVLSPEVTTEGDPPVPAALEGALLSSGNVPGAGDDPYSRMGIAKRVLKDFLDDVGVANVVLAGYAQAEPADGSNGVPLKHWVYEARAQDRFHMLEASYAYRFGYAENHAGILLDNPGEIYSAEDDRLQALLRPGDDRGHRTLRLCQRLRHRLHRRRCLTAPRCVCPTI